MEVLTRFQDICLRYDIGSFPLVGEHSNADVWKMIQLPTSRWNLSIAHEFHLEKILYLLLQRLRAAIINRRTTIIFRQLIHSVHRECFNLQLLLNILSAEFSLSNVCQNCIVNQNFTLLFRPISLKSSRSRGSKQRKAQRKLDPLLD